MSFGKESLIGVALRSDRNSNNGSSRVVIVALRCESSIVVLAVVDIIYIMYVIYAIYAMPYTLYTLYFTPSHPLITPPKGQNRAQNAFRIVFCADSERFGG